MELLDKNSLILQIGNLKLSDTEYTFGKNRTIGDFQYIPLEEKHDYWSHNQLGPFIYGDHRLGIEIKKEKNSLFFCYDANRSSYNAQNIAIGYFSKSRYHFIKEEFGDIYAQTPELVSRSMVTVSSLWRPKKITEKRFLYRGSIENNPTEQDLEHFQKWVKNIEIFTPAFQEDNLTKLSLVRINHLKDKEKKEKYLAYYYSNF